MKSLKFLTLFVILAFAGCSGSAEDTAIRIAQMQNFANVAERALTGYDERIEVAEGAIEKIQVILADPNLPIPAREEMQAAIATALEVKAQFEKAKVMALDEIQNIREAIAHLTADGIQPGEDLIVVGERMRDVGNKLPAPVGPIIALIGMIVAVLGEVRKRKAEKSEDDAWDVTDEADRIARGVIASVGVVLKKANKTEATAMKDTLKFEQREFGIRAGVKRILDT